MNPRDAEEAAQRDPLERARRLARFKARTEGKVWRYNPDDGLTLLVPCLDGSKDAPKPLDPFSLAHVA